jgi:hypothetical protein
LLGRKMANKCKNCHCDCHCKNDLHVPDSSLDTGGACTCENCECKRTYKKEKDHGTDISFENEVVYD